MSLYFEYFGLNREPFGLTPNPEFYYESEIHATALEWVKYAIEQREMGLVIGEIGSGKTVLSRLLVDSLDQEKYQICWIINPQLSPTALLKEICTTLFDLKPKYYKRDILKQITDGLVDLYQQGIHPVVIIDEAQSIVSKAVFDEIRLLTNFQTDTQNLLSVILFGQPELAKRLKHRAYRALVERIRFSITLTPFGLKDTKHYLLHRLQVAGYMKSFPFRDEAVERLWELSKGIPRVINHIASFSLLHAMSAGVTKIGIDQIDDSIKDIFYLNN